MRKVASDRYDGGETYFTEENGLGHLISAEGLHTKTYDLETGVSLLEFACDADGNLTSVTDRFGNATTVGRLADGTPFNIVSPDGLVTELAVDEHGQLTRIGYPDGTAHVFEYAGGDGLATAKIEPNGNRFEHFFDENGRVCATNNAEGGLWRFSRTKDYRGAATAVVETPNTLETTERLPLSTGAVNITSVTAAGETVLSSASADGLDSVVESDCGPRIETFKALDRMYGYEYVQSSRIATPGGLVLQTSTARDYTDADGDGRPEKTTETVTVNGKSAVFEHDVVGSTLTAVSPENRTATADYDPSTLLPVSSSVPGLHPTRYAYFADGKPESIAVGSRTTSFAYDGAGNLATVTDPMNRVVRFADYDPLGRPLRVERPDGTELRYGYDENGNATLLVTPMPAENSFAYNGINERETWLTPMGGSTSYKYNAERQLTEVALPSGKRIVNTYANGLLAQTTTDEWTNVYAYSCGELVGSIARGGESLSYGYDGRLTTAVSQTGTMNASLAFGYDDDFRLVSFGYAGASETYAYDDDGLLTRSGDFAVSRNADNGLPEAVSDGTFREERAFDGYGEIDSVAANINGGPVFGYQLQRNLAGQITRKTETVGGQGAVFSYAYDGLGRLLSVEKDGALVEEYRYDANGNRVYEANAYLGIAGRTVTSSVEDHTLAAGDVSYGFDFDDNLASRTDANGTTEYFYSSAGELTGVVLPDGTNITYTNDPLGRRIAKSVNGTVVEKYLWSGPTTLLAVYDGSGNPLQRFEYADSRTPYAMTASGSRYYLVYDQVGSLRLVADASGNTVKRIDCDSFGNVVVDTNESFAVPFGFAGGLRDRDTGLVRFGFRDYMPEIGKWTAKDPIDFAGGDSNLYGYVLNDPVNLVDPLGLIPPGWFEKNRPNIPSPKERHYNRNQYNQEVGYNKAKKDWTQLSPEKSVYHRMGPGNENNQKFVSPDGHSEAVFYPDGTIVTDPANIGTYNYSPPNNWAGHFWDDIVPYWIWGNSPDDPTTLWERLTHSYKGEKPCE